MDWINYLGLLAMVWGIVTGFGAAQFFKDYVFGMVNVNKWYWMLPKELLSCCLCLGFWVGLVYYQSIPMACLFSVSAETFNRFMGFIFSILNVRAR